MVRTKYGVSNKHFHMNVHVQDYNTLKLFQGEQVKEDKMGGERSTYASV